MTFPRYPKYKDSGVEWLGEVPEEWDIAPLKRNLSINNGKDHKHIEQEAGYPVYGSGGVFAWAGEYLYEGEAVLLGRKGTIDKPLYVNEKFWTVDTMFYAIANKNANSKYFYYVSTQIPFDLYSTNTALPSMTQSTLGNHIVAAPKIHEQSKIVAFLDNETAKIDALIAEQNKLVELLKEKRQGIISHAVTKGLNPNAKMKDSGVEWLGEVPVGWEVKRLKHVIQSISSGVSVNSTDMPAGQDEIGVLKTSCVYTGEFDSAENKTVVPEEYERVACPVLADTLIVSRMNTPDLVGAAGIVRESFKNLFLPDRLWQVQFATMSPSFVHYWTRTRAYRCQVEMACEGTSSSMQNLAQSDYRMFSIPYPEIKEQEAISDHLMMQLNQIDTLIDETNKASGLLKERRSALISAAVTGKIDVRNSK